MSERNSKLYLGQKWTNINVGEIITFFGIMMRISVEPCNMGGYLSYFVEDLMIQLYHIHAVKLRVYDYWGRYIMPIIIPKQIHIAFHSEARTSFGGEKCHQMCYFIRVFNDKSKMIFLLGSMVF